MIVVHSFRRISHFKIRSKEFGVGNALAMRISDWNRSGEFISFMGSICGLLAVVGLVACAVLAIDHLPQVAHCCDEAGERYYAPSGLMKLAVVVLFPVTMLVGFVMGFFLGFWQVSIATALLICAWVYLKGVGEKVEAEVMARIRKEYQETYDRNRGLK